MIKYNGKTVGSEIVNMQQTDFSKVTARPEFVYKGKLFYDETGQLREGTQLLAAEAAPELDEKNVTKNGAYNAADDGLDGYSKVNVAVPLGSIYIDQNCTMVARNNDPAGWSKVTVDVKPVTAETTITKNGVYSPTEGVDGFSKVKVDVANSENVAAPFFAKENHVDSVEEMVDTNKTYVLNSTGHIWVYKEGGTVEETVTEPITGTWATGRLGSDGSINSDYTAYVVTPHIDLAKYNVPFELHLKGIPFSNQSSADPYNTYCQYDKNKGFIGSRNLTNVDAFKTFWSGAELIDNGDGTCVIKFTPPVTNKSVEVGYVRFTGKGTEANANVYITYQTEVDGGESGWIDTGIGYKEPVSELTNLIQVNSAVRAFMRSDDYDSDDYSYTQVEEYVGTSGASREDLPMPFVLEWNKIENAILYAVSVNNQTYYTGNNKLSVSNFIPDTTYAYIVYALCEDGSMVAVKSGSFKTKSDATRMLNIDGIQNVRDIGGYDALNGKKVEYGLIYRGSAMDELVGETYPCFITDAGKKEFVERVGVKTDIDLRDERYVETYVRNPLGVDYYNRENESYLSYVGAVTKQAGKEYFADVFEYIVEQLVANKPVYIHCSGGCDRTGSLVFLLLGLLGVSESDLAKEYELSSFSKVGNGRFRNVVPTPEKPNNYNYSGMVEAIKQYKGTTFTDNFVLFATDTENGCGISRTTIDTFRSIMIG